MNACRSFILDSLEPYDKDQTIWASEYTWALSAWLLAIANETAEDYFWNLDSYEQPYVVDAKTREEIYLQDIDQAMYESFRLAFVTVSLVYDRMQKWMDQPKVDFQSNMVMLKYGTFVLKNVSGKLKNTKNSSWNRRKRWRRHRKKAACPEDFILWQHLRPINNTISGYQTGSVKTWSRFKEPRTTFKVTELTDNKILDFLIEMTGVSGSMG